MEAKAVAADQSPRREATYQDVLDAPEHLVAEIVDGELILSPRPALPHTRAASQLGIRIGGPFDNPPGGDDDRPGGWWILDEPELHFGKQVLVPDLAGWRRERMPVVPRTAFCTLAPDWVCEVVSPASASRDRVKKFRIYLREKVGYLWFVDPLARTLEVYQNEGERWVVVDTFTGNEKVRAEPFRAVELDMTSWWPPEEGAEGAPPAAEG